MTRTVLYVSPNARLGGAEQSLLLWSRFARRWRPVIYFLQDGPLVERFRREGLACHVHPGPRPRLSRPWSILTAARDIARVIRSERAGIVHSVMTYGHLFGAPAAVLARVPEVWFQHGPTGHLDWIAGRVPTRALLLNSAHTGREQARYHAHAGRTRVIHPGIEPVAPADFAEAGRAFRARHGIADGEVAIALIARISPMKGHLLFLEAAARVRAQAPGAKFLIVGAPFLPADEAYRAEVEARVRALGLAESVRFTGFLAESAYHAVAASDVVVNASVTPEPFGLTVLEGMLLGRAVIAPRAGGPVEIISPGRNGLFFEPNDPDSLAQAMRELVNSPEKRAALGAAARTTVLERFLVSRSIEELEAEYDSIISQ